MKSFSFLFPSVIIFRGLTSFHTGVPLVGLIFAAIATHTKSEDIQGTDSDGISGYVTRKTDCLPEYQQKLVILKRAKTA